LTFLKAARPASQSALLKLAETMTRTLAVPFGTWLVRVRVGVRVGVRVRVRV
jgi:hypothetical protein|tara:strand:- start:236 stop:391 length:156 start_codon:yes stop_codon:yes gene_type:complete